MPEKLDVPNVSPVKTKASNKTTKEPVGSLTKWQNKDQSTYYEFVGNGYVNGNKLLHNIISSEAAHDEKAQKTSLFTELEQDKKTKDSVCNEIAPQLFEQPQQEIPKGKIVQITLKQLLAAIEPALKQYQEHQQRLDDQVDSNGSSYDNLRFPPHTVGIKLPLGY